MARLIPPDSMRSITWSTRLVAAGRALLPSRPPPIHLAAMDAPDRATAMHGRVARDQLATPVTAAYIVRSLTAGRSPRGTIRTGRRKPGRLATRCFRAANQAGIRDGCRPQPWCRPRVDARSKPIREFQLAASHAMAKGRSWMLSADALEGHMSSARLLKRHMVELHLASPWVNPDAYTSTERCLKSVCTAAFRGEGPRREARIAACNLLRSDD